MADFSVYGTPSEEWVKLAKNLPEDDPSADVVLKKQAANVDRERLAASGMLTLASEVVMTDYEIPIRDGTAIPARTYRSQGSAEKHLPVYIHLHGGGFVFGTLASEDAICAQLAVQTNIVVLNVCYRHTPEHRYPSAWNDIEDAYQWLHKNIHMIGGDPENVAMGGISAGAWLTASFVLNQHLHGAMPGTLPVVGQILMIPAVVHHSCYAPQLAQLKDLSTSSWKQCEHAPILPVQRAEMFERYLDVANLDPADLRLNPGNASTEQVRGLPPSVFGVAGMDPLRDEGLLWAKKLAEASVATNVSVFPGVPHGFRRHGEHLSQSKRWDDVMANGIKWILSRPAATGNFEIKV